MSQNFKQLQFQIKVERTAQKCKENILGTSEGHLIGNILNFTSTILKGWLINPALIIQIDFKASMIYLQKEVQHEGRLLPTMQKMLPQLFRMFLIYLQGKKIKYSTLPKESSSTQATVSTMLQLGTQGYSTDVLCKICTQWSESQQILHIFTEFKVTGLAGQRIQDFPVRTQMEMLASIAEMNKAMTKDHFGLTLSFKNGVYLFKAKTFFLMPIDKEEVKKLAFQMIKTSFQGFLKYFGQLEEAKLLKQQQRINSVLPLSQLLQKFYLNKNSQIKVVDTKHTATVKSCFALLLHRANRHNRAFKFLAQSNRNMAVRFHLSEDPPSENIAKPISIIRRQKPDESLLKILRHNLQQNKAVTKNPEIISLSKVKFEPRKSFGFLRKGKQNEIVHFPADNERQQMHEEHLIIKRCPSNTTKQTKKLPSDSPNRSESTSYQSASIKSQSESGHQNEHNFLLLTGNWKCPYIGNYYLDVGEGVIKTISQRTIMTRFVKGDLFTEVAYRSHKKQYQYSLIEYLTIFEQMTKGVKFLHQNKIVHRDLKPTNVLFEYRGHNKMRCRIIDFGSCNILHPQLQGLFNQRLFTTPQFNLTYRQATKLDQNIGKLFKRQQYESHQLFDIFGVATTIEFLLEQSNFSQINQLRTVIGICKHPNPYFRFTPEELLAVIQHLKVDFIQQTELFGRF